MGLPVRELPDIMTISLERKRMPLLTVNLLEQVHQRHPQQDHGYCIKI